MIGELQPYIAYGLLVSGATGYCMPFGCERLAQGPAKSTAYAGDQYFSLGVFAHEVLVIRCVLTV